MHAITVEDDRLVWSTAPRPDLTSGCVRIAVAAAGVNRADLVQRAGRYPPPPGASPILGLEVSGRVIEVSGDVEDGPRVGDRVCALLTGGGYAEQVVVPTGHCLRLPDRVDWVEGAAFAEVFATAWLNLAREGELMDAGPGASVLLHAGGSGVGTAAIQVAGLLGASCFVTAGSDDKIARCVALGADGGANRHDGPWLEAVKAWREHGTDVILDPVGADYLAPNLSALAPDGRLVLIGLLSGRTAELDLSRLLMKRLRIKGSTLRARSVAFKSALFDELRTAVVPAWSQGDVAPVVHGAVPIPEAEAAHAELATNDTFGALVLTVNDSV